MCNNNNWNIFIFTLFCNYFIRCCEETLRVLRKKSEPVLTTLEALLYDPIYSWSLKKPRSEQSQQSIPDISMLINLILQLEES